MNEMVVVLVIGSVAGILGGFFRIAGGVIIVPALVFLLGMPTKAAIGSRWVRFCLRSAFSVPGSIGGMTRSTSTMPHCWR
jgi:uncharacterized membrane protein YfcA